MEEKKPDSAPAPSSRGMRAARIGAVVLAVGVLVGFVVLAQKRADERTERDKDFASTKDARMVGSSSQQYLMEQSISPEEARRRGLPAAKDQYTLEGAAKKPEPDEFISSSKSGVLVPPKKKTEPMRKKNK